MDVNGTRFHLLFDEADWTSCLLNERNIPVNSVDDGDVEYTDNGLHLREEVPRFTKIASKFKDPATEAINRRGVARDENERWYLIDNTRRKILVQQQGTNSADEFWSLDDPLPQSSAGTGDFQPQPKTSSAEKSVDTTKFELHGLALTTDGYLVAGVKDGDYGGLVFLDLVARNIQWVWWGSERFIPFDIAATADGGLWVLDTKESMLWRVYEAHLPPSSGVVISSPDFVPANTSPQAAAGVASSIGAAVGKALYKIGSNGRYITVENGPQNHAFVLIDSGTSSQVLEYKPDEIKETDQWRVFILRANLDDQTTVATDETITALDFAYVEITSDCINWLDLSPREIEGTKWVLLVVESQGNQAIAFRQPVDEKLQKSSDGQNWVLESLTKFLPMRRWSGQAIVTADCRVYYDAAGQWSPLRSFGDNHFVQHGVIVTSPDFPAALPLQPLDGEEYGCVWHRLIIDGEIPSGTKVSLRARAADDPLLIKLMPWLDQPAPYLRSNPSELAYYTPPPFRPLDAATETEDSEETMLCLPGEAFERQLRERGAGAWELLFQDVRGRYLQLEITLDGTGRTTPMLYALRVWYPRFSYLEHYLPAIYREDPLQASFLDRWLANFEGFFTHLEDQIEQVPSLLDPRITPPETLEWLAGWMGLLLDPQWTEKRRRFFVRRAMDFYRLRGTMRGLLLTIRLYLDHESQINDGLFDTNNFSWRVRLREDYLTAVTDLDCVKHNQKEPCVADAAHRFTVLVPSGLNAPQKEMIRRIVQLEKPAHTDFTIKPCADSLIMDDAILEIDTLLCEPTPLKLRFELGQASLSELVLRAQSKKPNQFRADRDVICD